MYIAPSSPPQDVMVTVLSSTEIQVNWTEVPERDRNGIITLYEVMYERFNMDMDLLEMNVNTSSFSIILSDLVPGQAYNISVRAYTGVGPGPYSTPEQMVLTDEERTF